MPVDVAAAARFLAAHARVLDRRRFDLVLGRGDAEPVLSALDAYRNPDGGYGWGLEPDLRTPGSQPITALHVFEVLEECGAAGASRAAAVCDWLATVAHDDGGLPFVVPIDDPAACAPWFTGADPTTSSFHGTVAVVGAANRLARHDPAVAAHPWLRRATRYCLDHLATATSFHAYEVAFALRLLAVVGDEAALAKLAAAIPPSGLLPVEGGVEGEVLRPLVYAPEPDSAVRRYLAPEVVAADLDRLAQGQRDDGGWEVDFASFSPAARLEWRGDETVRAVKVLAANG
jgi:hypothetical protein